MHANEYNVKSMKRYGWGPHDLGLEPDATIDAITAAVLDYQLESGLAPDGKVGPMTWRRLEADREFNASESYPTSLGFIQVAGRPVPVDFNARMCGPSSPYSLVGQGGHSRRKQHPTQVVWHWDACLNAETCYKILQRRKISSHGVIDNDGTFYQMLDFADHTGWHAGDSKVNRRSIGIDISNAVYPKYQKYYAKRWGPRPEIKAIVHGREHELLGYYDAQIRTAAKLAAFIAKHFAIDLVTPDSTTVISKPHLYKGHLAHYHIKNTKWDVAGFPFDEVLGYTEPLDD